MMVAKGEGMEIEISASCKCGAAQFKSDDKPILQLCCHCDDCRKATGNDFSTVVFFKLDKVNISGNLTPHIFTSDLGNKTERLFCTDCQQMMFDKSAGFPNMLGVMAEHIDLPFVAQPQMHVWTQSKLPHVKIAPDMKQYKKGIS